MESNKAWRYCVVGNIKKFHTDLNGILRYGTATYVGGAKVYLCGKYWNAAQSTIGTIGLNRFKSYQFNDVPPELIENVRVSKAYKPSVLALMGNYEFNDCWWGNTNEDKEAAEHFVQEWNNRLNG